MGWWVVVVVVEGWTGTKHPQALLFVRTGASYVDGRTGPDPNSAQGGQIRIRLCNGPPMETIPCRREKNTRWAAWEVPHRGQEGGTEGRTFTGKTYRMHNSIVLGRETQY